MCICRFAYVEFVDKESVDNALKLDDTPFKGRQLKVGDCYCRSIIPILMIMYILIGTSETTQYATGSRWSRSRAWRSLPRYFFKTIFNDSLMFLSPLHFSAVCY